MAERLNTNPETEKTELNESELGKLTMLATEYREQKIDRAREDVKYWADDYKDVETQFAKHEIKNQAEFERWEEDAAHAFKKMREAESDSLFESRYERDDLERISNTLPPETIEAKSGDYYDERNLAILEAVRKNEDKDEREKELESIYSLHQLVARHIQAIMDYESRGSDPVIYNMHRRMAHNNLIRGLNNINRIADKYGVKRLIFRDFETNDFTYESHKDRHGETNARAEYDRSSVEAYVRRAFSRDFNKAEKENNITTRRDSLVAMFHGDDF